MKNRYIVSSFMALAVLFGCVPDHRDDNMPDSAVYFVDNVANNGVQAAVMYDVQSTIELPVYVYCSGYYGGTPRVSAEVAADYIEVYNAENNTELKALPEECYTLLNTVADVSDRKAKFALKFDVEAIKALAAQDGVDLSDYVVALNLDSDDMDIAGYKDKTFDYYLVYPDLRNAIVTVRGSAVADNRMTLTVELPFDNQWDFEFELDYDIAGTFGIPDTKRGNSIPAKYSCTPAPADFIEQVVVEGGEFKFAPGTNIREYTLVIPETYSRAWEKGRTNNFAVSIKNARLTVDGVQKELPVEGATLLASYPGNHKQKLIKTAANYENSVFKDEQLQYYNKTLSEFGLGTYNDRNSYCWDPQSSNDTYLDRFYNGNGYGWKGRWAGGFGPANQIPLYVHVDMKKKQTVSGMEWWRRGDGNVGDTKKIEVYALDDCTYTWKGADLSYASDAITYLGTIDFGARENAYTCGAMTFDTIETQHLMFNIVESTRNNATDCAEIVIWY